MTRIYTDVVGDLFHWGHVNLFKQLRGLGDCLIVGVNTDELIESYKRRPILTLDERVQMVSACRYVDEVIAGAPAPISVDFIRKHNIDVVARGDDLAHESMTYWYQAAIELGIFKTVPYTPGVSTTAII
ncbi:MAG: adenylyltransferase/cytidyltransferase family protein, partial [Caldilineaceae bacterium]|nr:adenylyltransferase/cytidyltransferase family protein [Caldilineaceae bacterium]